MLPRSPLRRHNEPILRRTLWLLAVLLVLNAALGWFWRDGWPGMRPSLSLRDPVDPRVRDHRLPADSPPCDSVESMVQALRIGGASTVWLDYGDFASAGIEREQLAEPIQPIPTARRRAVDLLAEAQERLQGTIPLDWYRSEDILVISSIEATEQKGNRVGVQRFDVSDLIAGATLIDSTTRTFSLPGADEVRRSQRLLADLPTLTSAPAWNSATSMHRTF